MDGKIEKKFNEAASTYDKQRQFLIPCFDDFYGMTIRLIETGLPSPHILDIGAGTGLLSSMILEKYRDAYFTLIDISGEMLDVAMKRFAGLNNFTYMKDNYLNSIFSKKFDFVVSALSIHHLDDDEKRLLYRKIYGLLNDNGIFINADQVCSEFSENEQTNRKMWFAKIESSPLTEKEKQDAYERMKLDKMATLSDNLTFLRESGFAHPEVFFKFNNFTVFYCKKN